MKKRMPFVIVGIILLATLILLFNRKELPVSTPEAAGLVWQECQTTEYLSSWQQAELCLAGTELEQEVEDGFSHASRVGYDDFRMQIGREIYQTRHLGSILSFETFLLTKNNWPINLQMGNFTAYSPNIGLYDVAGKVAWEFVSFDRPVLFYNGRNLNHLYNLDQAYSPYLLNGKLVFIAQQDEDYFVVYDGKRLTPDFDNVVHAYCCETSMYSPVVQQGVYFFYATRDGKGAFIMLTSSEK